MGLFVPGSGPGGRWFKSTRPDHSFQCFRRPLDGPAGLSPGALVRSASKNDVYKPNGTASQSQKYLQSPSARCILLGPITHFSGESVNQDFRPYRAIAILLAGPQRQTRNELLGVALEQYKAMMRVAVTVA